MSTSQVSYDKSPANDLDLFEASLKIQRKEKPSAPDAEDNISYCEPLDLASTSHILSYNRDHQKMLNNYDRKKVGHNRTCLDPGSFASYAGACPSAPELDTDECGMTDNQFDALQYATPTIKLNSAIYAESICDLDAIEYEDDSTCHTHNTYKSAFDSTASVEDKGFKSDGYPSAPELDADDYAITNDQFDATTTVKLNSARYAQHKECDVDAIEYSDDLSYNTDISYMSAFDSTARVEDKGFETFYVKPEGQESHMYRKPYEPIVKKKKGSLSKLKSNIFGLVRKKYKKCFPSKNYGWDRSDSWIKIALV